MRKTKHTKETEEAIIEALKEGKTIIQIIAEIGTHSQYIMKVRKKMGLAGEYIQHDHIDRRFVLCGTYTPNKINDSFLLNAY